MNPIAMIRPWGEIANAEPIRNRSRTGHPTPARTAMLDIGREPTAARGTPGDGAATDAQRLARSTGPSAPRPDSAPRGTHATAPPARPGSRARRDPRRPPRG